MTHNIHGWNATTSAITFSGSFLFLAREFLYFGSFCVINFALAVIRWTKSHYSLRIRNILLCLHCYPKNKPLMQSDVITLLNSTGCCGFWGCGLCTWAGLRALGTGQVFSQESQMWCSVKGKEMIFSLLLQEHLTFWHDWRNIAKFKS